MARVISTLPPLVRRMLTPDFYPHATDPEIRLVQTHISYVFLTGAYAYKIKKPLKFPFLDFSSLEHRRQFCFEELKLNRRTAPEIYLDVVAITADGDRFHMSGAGTPIEYAVKMRQFGEESLFSNLLAKGAPDAEQVKELAKTVANFHLVAAKANPATPFGHPEQIRKMIEDNFSLTATFVGELQTRQQFAETKVYTDRFFANDCNLLQKRVLGGRIRECHGDLHLGNICLWDGNIRLFDCIEFNEALRFIDVMNDAAFIAMDLDAAGRVDLATQFINTYVEWTGDWEGLEVFPLYRWMRAYVRAMVHSLASDEPELTLQEKERARRSAEQYYRLAWKYTQGNKGQLILMAGVSGAGKSTIASVLAQKTGAIHIRSDAVRKHLGNTHLDQRLDEKMYSPAMNVRIYERLLDLGFLLAQKGFCVVLDAKYDRHDFRKQAIARALEANLSVHIVWCIAPKEVLHMRLETRRNDVSDARADLLTEQMSAFEPFDGEEQCYLTVVDTSQSVDWDGLLDCLDHRAQA